MAKLSGPLMSAEARGRVGGLVYNTWRGIRYCKAKTGPAQPRTQLQLHIRAIAIGLARRWQQELQTVRDAWNLYATQHLETDFTNTPVRLTGLNWWLRINTRQIHAANAVVLNPPALPAPGPVVAFSAAGGAAQIVCTWTSPLNDDYNVTIYLQGPHSPGMFGSLPRARFRLNANADAATVTLTALSPGYYSLWARMYDTVTGLVSMYELDTTTVT